MKKEDLRNLRVIGLKKSRADLILEADFSIGVGQRAALIGESGSGKTSLLRVLAGLDPLGTGDSGQVFLGDQEITRLPPQDRHAGFVFQDQVLFSALNVFENIAFGLKARRIEGAIDELVYSWLDRVDLRGKAKSSVEKLSGGERQRVAFVRALIWQPKFLLLDEPFSSMDVALRSQLRKELIGLHTLWPAPLLLVTHDQTDISSLATQELKLTWDRSTGVRRVCAR